MRRLITYLIVISSLIGFSAYAQMPGDNTTLPDKDSFEGRNTLKKRERVYKNKMRHAAKLERSGPKDAAKRWTSQKPQKRNFKLFQRKREKVK